VTQGYLAIGGDWAAKAEILIDDHSYGFAPKRLALPLGVHRVTLVLTDGTRVGPRALDITALHTARNPMRFSR